MNVRNAKKLNPNDEIKIKSTGEIVKVLSIEIYNDTDGKNKICIIHTDNHECYTHDEIS